MKNRFIKFIFVCFVLITSISIQAQSKVEQANLSKRIDSLNHALIGVKEDTTRLRLYVILVEICSWKDNLKYGEPILKLVDKLLPSTTDTLKRKNLLSQQTQTYVYLAEYYSKAGEILKQLEILQQGLMIAQKMKFKKGISRYFVELQFFYAEQGDTAQALDYLERAIELEKVIADTSRISRGYFLIGRSYAAMRRFDKALEYYYKATPRIEARKDTSELLDLYFSLGDAYREKHVFSEALKYFEKCLWLASKLNDFNAIVQVRITIGMTYENQKDFAKAIDYHLKTIALCEKAKEEVIGQRVYLYLSIDYFKQKDFKNARRSFSNSLPLLKMATMPIQSKLEMEQVAYKIDSACKDFEGAYAHYQQYIAIQKKLKNDEVLKMSARDRFQRDSEKQKLEAKAEQDKKDAIANGEKRKQQIIIVAVSAGLLLMFILAGVILRSLRLNQKKNEIIAHQKHLVEEKNHEITDSINYAKRIQSSILPPLEEIHSALPNSFVLFKPKDIVSGDFYWFHKTNDSVLIAAADCTGHGVPGAFMSMLNSDKLNEAVETSKDVSKILQLVNIGLKKALRQSDKDDSTRDGMDIAICKLIGMKLEYAGANRPLWIIRNGKKEIEETKATKTAIGGLTEDEQEFTKHIVELQKGDTVYIFTDGFADQFSPDDKKLMTKKFKETLYLIQDKSMEEQRAFLNAFIENWKGNMEQTDDILVIGIRI
jgi:serine phosphatase RsbU (regulator of sigma subunit)